MPKLLFITYKPFVTVKEGGGQGSLRNYQNLCKILGENNVDTIYVHNDDSHRSISTYIEAAIFLPWGYYMGLTPHRCKQIINIANQYEVIFIDRSLFGIIAKKLKQSGFKGTIITFFHNVEKIYFDAKLNSAPYVIRKLISNIADINDKLSCRFSDKIITLNDRDTKTIEKLYSRKADWQIPVSMTDKYARKQYTSELTRKRPQCMFLGAYFAANNEGILWFVHNVLPHVDIEMKIVGKGMSKLKQEALELKDIEVISDAPDLLPYFEEADLMILPIFSGSGMKVKTCESLMYGKNIIGTDEAFEGYNLDGDKVGGRCNTAEEFIAAIQSFIDNPRPRFNNYSRATYLAHNSDNAIEQLFQQIFK